MRLLHSISIYSFSPPSNVYTSKFTRTENLITVIIPVLFSVGASVQRNVQHTSTVIPDKQTASSFTEILQLQMEICSKWLATTSFTRNVIDIKLYKLYILNYSNENMIFQP